MNIISCVHVNFGLLSTYRVKKNWKQTRQFVYFACAHNDAFSKGKSCTSTLWWPCISTKNKLSESKIHPKMDRNMFVVSLLQWKTASYIKWVHENFIVKVSDSPRAEYRETCPEVKKGGVPRKETVDSTEGGYDREDERGRRGVVVRMSSFGRSAFDSHRENSNTKGSGQTAGRANDKYSWLDKQSAPSSTTKTKY